MPQTEPQPTQQTAQTSTNAEVLLAFQKQADEMVDPMAEAIQRELGSQLMPISDPDRQALANALEATGEEVFRAVNLTKAYGGGTSYTEVIKGISFGVSKGEYVVIYGPSGSGKSTLLHLLAGLEPPTRGSIMIRNHTISNFTDDELALYHREEIGLVFQSFNLLESLTSWENVAFPLMLAGAPVEWRRHEAIKLLDRFGMAEFAMYYPNQLSGGQQQRIALARALVHDPELLFIDEPTGNLDSKVAKTVMKEIARLNTEGRTIVLVTHAPEFLKYASRVFYIRDGLLMTTPGADMKEMKEEKVKDD